LRSGMEKPDDCTFQSGDDDSWEVRRPKTLEVEGQGCSYSFSL